jgi:uncharacterized membrane protein YdfJ with MMPL/SSD domain
VVWPSMSKLIEYVLRNRRAVLIFWALAFCTSAYFSVRLQEVLRGSSDIIRHSPSDKFGKGSAYQFPVVLESPDIRVGDSRFAQAARSLEHALVKDPGVRQVRSFWNSGMPELLGKNERSALLLVTPNAEDFAEAENLTGGIREISRKAVAGSDFSVKVTGTVAMFHDLNRNSASDLLKAETIGIPLTLVILLIVFGAPLAASLPILLAVISVTAGAAGLYCLSYWMPVNVFAQNAISMIGLGVGVDYALFLVSRFRQELNDGAPATIAALNAARGLGRALVFSGLTVAIGFLSLFLVNARFLHSLALGGVIVVAVSLAATLTLLPVLLSYLGGRVNWPRKPGSPSRAGKHFEPLWEHWARSTMRRPWLHVIPAFMVLAVFIAPVPGLKVWNVGARDLDAQMEARQGLEMLDGNFSAGWMGPVILVLQRGNSDPLHAENQEAMLALTSRLGADGRIASARNDLSADGTTGLIVLITTQTPEGDEVKELVAELRRDTWQELSGSGMSVQVGGATAMVADFDEEMLASLRRVIPAVLALTFVALLILFKSLLIPLKAIALNLLSVLAAYGFLVYVFQDGIGADLIGLDPPGGLNSLVVLMLFTILFGLSMDYEVFLLTHIAEEYRRSADNAASVVAGLQRTAGLITSAAFIMVCLFASFGFTRLTATREFGLGLAFAVFLDATLIRVVLVPALMELFGTANWWTPAWLRRVL